MSNSRDIFYTNKTVAIIKRIRKWLDEFLNFLFENVEAIAVSQAYI